MLDYFVLTSPAFYYCLNVKIILYTLIIVLLGLSARPSDLSFEDNFKKQLELPRAEEMADIIDEEGNLFANGFYRLSPSSTSLPVVTSPLPSATSGLTLK